ncbi:hypothetical protein [Rubellicoccus peritrichatus]|uniref:Uncharacterized protein n=1 Tax=Rubellicoccus peritrichatus TaxID=3080537 RepID=A0AAQ3LIH1_9BACT|nr:hypothetical protein [Puniceicoccus sp. CR14]WOO42709.1 hypothetical protein RZN69_06365 [Puniceicoccus sp. CR14]
MNWLRAVGIALFLPLAGATFTAANTTEAEPFSIDYVAWYYKPAQSFQRIAEYFGTPELTGRKIILRSDPKNRGGLYFVVHIDEDANELPKGSSFEVSAVFPDSPKAKLFKFPLPEPTPDHRVVWIGLTGDDEPADDEPPVSWLITIKGPQGEIIASKKSFLWSDREAYEAS